MKYTSPSFRYQVSRVPSGSITVIRAAPGLMTIRLMEMPDKIAEGVGRYPSDRAEGVLLDDFTVGQ